MVLARWTAHPARSRPRDLMLFAAVALLTLGAVMAAFESLLLVVLAALFLLLGLGAFLFPTHYQLTEDGVEERRLGQRRSRRWDDLRRYQVGPGAALVSPFARPNWLDRYRGLILYLDGADRDQVVEILAAHIAGEQS